MKSWKQVAATIVNKFMVVLYEENVIRLVFGDQVTKGDETEYHSAILLSASDARELANSIIRALDEQEAKKKKVSENAVSAGQ